MTPRKEFKRITVPGTATAPLPPKTRAAAPKAPRSTKLPKFTYLVDYGYGETVKVPKARSLRDARVIADAERRAAGLHTDATHIVRALTAYPHIMKRYRYRIVRRRRSW